MQDIDLGDRSGLIDLIYGPAKDTISTTASVNTLTPLTETKREKREKKPASRVSCTFCTAFMLFVLSALAILLAAYVGYWYTKMEYEKKLAMVDYVPAPRRNLSDLASEILYEEEEVDKGVPSATELKLPESLVPIWYNVTIKPYLPGYVDIEPSKNLTTDGHMLIKMKARADTKEIVLNAFHLTFPRDISKIQLLTDKPVNKVRKVRNTNETSEEGTESLMDNMMEDDSEDSMNNTMSSTTMATTTTESTTTTTTTTTMSTQVLKKKLMKTPTMASYNPVDNKVTNLMYNETLQKLVLTLERPIKQGDEVILKLPFNGVMSDSLNGFYTKTYKDKDGKTKYMAVSNMQPTYARKFLPCFDEPQLKGIWKISVIHPNGTVARSNAELEGEPLEADGWLTSTFKETDPISSYLLGVTVTDFISSQSTTNRGQEINIWARPDVANSTKYALENTEKVIAALEDYYGIPMPAKKLDIFAIPTFEAGSKENPGLMMFSECSILFDPKVDDAQQKEVIIRSLIHELNHQWFGNLVAISGWDSLWLNEAVARQVEFMAAEKILNGKLKEHEHEIAESLENAFIRDARSSSHPLTTSVDTPSDAKDIIDVITNDKGAAVLRMIREIIGEEAFRKGIQNYLKSNTNMNANYNQLWSSINQEVPQKLMAWNDEKFDVADFANKWILQMGYPVLDVYRIDRHTVEISQRRFKYDNLTPEKAKYRNALYWYKWDIPLFIEINGKKIDLIWLHEAARIPLNLTDTILINSDSNGYYRVNYDEAGWEGIVKQLNEDHTKFSTNARGRILSDAFALAAANQLPYETVFNLTQYIGKEKEFLPIRIALQNLINVYNEIKYTPEGENFKKTLMKQIEGLYGSIDLKNLTSADEAELLNIKRQLIIVEAYCQLNPITCRKPLRNLFEKNLLEPCKASNYTSGCSTVPPTLRKLVYCEGVSKGDEEIFELMSKYGQNEISCGERKNLMSSLGCSRDPSSLETLLRKSTLNRNGAITQSDIQTIVYSMNHNPVGNLLVTDYIIDNWKKISEKLADDHDILAVLLKSGLSARNEREIAEIQHFVSEHPQTTRGFQAFRSTLEHARSLINWHKKNEMEVTTHFDNKKNH